MPAPDVREGPPGAGDGTARIRTGPGLYVHVPFCRRRCGYCDFYVEIRDDAIRARTVEAILEEAERRAGSWPHGCFDSVFLGGGTPSLLGPERLERLLRGLRERLPIGADAEWTMEANPESANAELLDAALAGGVNRLSLGAQSFDPAELAMLDRLHDADQARLAVARARAAGFENVNLDLIYGLPAPPGGGGRAEERAARWEDSLRAAIDLAPEHLSAYLLTLEARTAMGRARDAGRIVLPDDEQARAQYETARATLAGAGYERYEISNWARPGRACRHNLHVWRGGRYLGLGPGAHGYAGETRRANRPDLAAYLAAVEAGEDPPHETQPVDEVGRREELLLLGLRLHEGISWRTVEAEFGLERTARLRQHAARWVDAGLLESGGGRFRVAAEGLFVMNALVAELLEAAEAREPAGPAAALARGPARPAGGEDAAAHRTDGRGGAGSVAGRSGP